MNIFLITEIIKGIINSHYDFFIHELDAERVVYLMRNKGLLMDDDIEMIEDISTEQKRCGYIFSTLKRSSLCFQKFILLLSENSLHGDIIAKIIEGNMISYLFI